MWCPGLQTRLGREKGSEKGRGGLISSRVMMTRGFMIAKSSNPIYIHEEKKPKKKERSLYTLQLSLLNTTFDWQFWN